MRRASLLAEILSEKIRVPCSASGLSITIGFQEWLLKETRQQENSEFEETQLDLGCPRWIIGSCVLFVFVCVCVVLI